MNTAENKEMRKRIAKILRTRREALGLSITDIAAKTGISQPAMSVRESHGQVGSITAFVSHCVALGLYPPAVLAEAIGGAEGLLTLKHAAFTAKLFRDMEQCRLSAEEAAVAAKTAAQRLAQVVASEVTQ